MSLRNVPAPNTFPDVKETVVLDGETFILRFRWNFRMLTWFLDISKSDGTPLVYGRRLVCGTGLVGQQHYLEAPLGLLTAFDTTNRDVDASLEDLGIRVLLLYMDVADVTAIRHGG